ncbi:hypothetical protein [Actinoplanes sp. NBRC 101535]|uniref:hypothetical protein n=1 Tax=Actinoplanes sp. NBRC 101535 TaxID=3032196 RepID=UPI002556104B|nr:hypothetical protein [Actinoplanes sp. NBRC 101535]
MPDLEPSVAHAQALAQLAATRLAVLGSALTVYLDEVPDQAEYPYAVVWTAGGSPLGGDAERLSGWGGEVVTTVTVTVAGLARADVIGGVDRLILALHRWRPVLPGRRPGDVAHDGGGGPPVLDPVPADGGRPVWTSAVLFSLHSSPMTS